MYTLFSFTLFSAIHDYSIHNSIASRQSFGVGFIFRVLMLIVSLHMRLERHRLDEALFADCTFVWPFAGVRHDVVFERFRLAEGTFAEVTGERFDATVNNSYVTRHVPCCRGRMKNQYND